MPWCMPGNSGPVIPWCMPGNTQPGNARKCTGNSPEIDPLRPRSSGQAGITEMTRKWSSFPAYFRPFPVIGCHFRMIFYQGHCRPFPGKCVPFPVIAGSPETESQTFSAHFRSLPVSISGDLVHCEVTGRIELTPSVFLARHAESAEPAAARSNSPGKQDLSPRSCPPRLHATPRKQPLKSAERRHLVTVLRMLIMSKRPRPPAPCQDRPLSVLQR